MNQGKLTSYRIIRKSSNWDTIGNNQNLISVIIPFFWFPPSLIDWGWLIVAGVGGSFAHIFIISALHFAPASILQPFNYVMLVWATILGFLIFDDLPDHLTVLGATVIVISGLYAWNRERLN